MFFIRNASLPSDATILHSHQQWTEKFLLLHSYQYLIFVVFWLAMFMIRQWYFTVVLFAFSKWHMTLSIFSYVYLPSVHILVHFWIRLCWVLCLFWIIIMNNPYQICVLQMLFLVYGLSFHCLDIVFHGA